jgi:hypothetical protein
MSTKDELNKNEAFARRFDWMQKPFAAREGDILPESARAVSTPGQSALA